MHERVFEAEWDEEGVYFYQAYNDPIADWAIENQRQEDIYRNILRTIKDVVIRLGGPNPPPEWNPTRMTWIKPSFAWMLYRSGYGRKQNQTRVLKIKLSHDTVEGIHWAF